MAKDPVIKKDEEIPPEILAREIKSLAESARALLGTKLNKRALILLLQDACGPTQITRKQIELVLDNAAKLDRLYLK